MVDFYSKIRKQQRQNLPFVLYSKPNSDTVIGLLQQNSILFTVTDFTESGFVFSSFDGNQTYIIPENQSEICNIILDKKEIDTIENESHTPDENAKTNFETLVTKGIQAIKKKEFKKVILSRKETIDLIDFDLITTFEKLLQLYPATFAYCFFHPKVGAWLGATPEQLIKFDNPKFETMALAGTQKKNSFEEIKWQDKEKQEQQIVTDYIVSELNKVAENILVSKPYSVKAGNIWHIRTDISGSLNLKKSLKDVVHLLHPTPAVCGLPKKESKAFILENENYDRTFYTGFLGELNSNVTSKKTTSDLFVNLRCMNIESTPNSIKANLYMGCGITKDSIPEKEWEESVHKSMTMKRVLEFRF